MNPLTLIRSLACSAFVALNATAQDTLYYSALDGSVVGTDIVTGRDRVRFRGSDFFGPFQAGGRQIAFDPVTRLLHYWAGDHTVRSLHVDTRAAGLTLARNAIPGSFSPLPRPLCIDSVARRLYVPRTDGAVEVFDIDRRIAIGRVPRSAFANSSATLFRRVAADVRSGRL